MLTGDLHVAPFPAWRRPPVPADARQRQAGLAAWSPSGGDIEVRLRVRPVQAGWSVEAEGVEPSVFERGSDAERHARRLAQGLARMGRHVAISVYDARDVLVGTITFFGLAPTPRTEHLRRYPWT